MSGAGLEGGGAPGLRVTGRSCEMESRKAMALSRGEVDEREPVSITPPCSPPEMIARSASLVLCGTISRIFFTGR
jgi:hypothetical protein